MVRTSWSLVLAIVLFSNSMLQAMERGTVATAHQVLVPQVLLALLHAPEVQQELKLSASQIEGLEQLFGDVDGPWFRARLLPAEQERETIAGLEEQVHQWFSSQATDEQHQRLRQLEYQAQSIRSLLRTDVAKSIGLTDSQQQQLANLARESDEAQGKLNAARARGEAVEELQATATRLVKKEQSSLPNIVKPEQLQKVGKLIGEPFNTKGLKRIYPMAPEFVPVDQWLNSPPLTMQALRGQVVLVHFYAFQCHNCHANFDVYQRWHQELSDQGVTVVGIQTPETARERDPEAVKSAAQERNLHFPIIVDLESENWKAYGNTMWPTVYVVDKKGYIRHWWQGELRWQGATGDQTIETIVHQLLAED